MEEVALYHPYVSPSIDWIKSTLLLFDSVGSIAPWDFEGVISPDLREAHADGVWEPFSAMDMDQADYREEVEGCLLEFADRHEYKFTDTLQPSPVETMALVDNKLSYFVGEALKELSLVRRVAGNGLIIHEHVAGVILSITARRVAARSSTYTLDRRISTATDIPQSVRFAYDSYEQEERRWRFWSPQEPTPLSCRELLLETILPVPRADVSIADVVHFRTKYADEVANLRLTLAKAVEAIQAADDPARALEIAVREFETSVAQAGRASRGLTRPEKMTVAVLATSGSTAISAGAALGSPLASVAGAAGAVASAVIGSRRLRRMEEAQPANYLVRAEKRFGS